MICIDLLVALYTRDVDNLYYIFNVQRVCKEVQRVFWDSLNIETEDIKHVDIASCSCWDSRNLFKNVTVLI